MKRASEQSPVDYAADRRKWAGLVALAHTAADTQTGAALSALSEMALTADSCWRALAPYPRGLVCTVLARTAWAYGRQTDAEARAQLAPLLIASAGLVDELHQQTATPAAPIETLAPEAPERITARLPYADA